MFSKEFNKFSLAEKADLIWKNGSLITHRPYYGYTINLYALMGNLVEVWYHNETNKIYDINLIDEERHIDRYLDRIELPNF